MKYLFVLLLVFALAACSEEMPVSEGGSTSAVEQTPDYSMDSFISAYEDAGATIDPERKPAYGMIGAVDGILFYNGSNPVKIYEYRTDEAYENALVNFPALAELNKKGNFVLDTNDERAKEIFNSVE